MLRLRFPGRIAAWLALGSIAFNAFWPLLANARPGTPALPSEICSATGLRHASGGAPGDAPDQSVQPSHCLLCPFNAERGATIPGVKQVLFSPAAAIAQPAAHFEVRRPQAVLQPAAPPRAPPLSS